MNAAPSPITTGTAPERAVLESWLDFHRASVVRKVAGLSERAARQRLVPSRTSLAGLLRHLAAVEAEWFQDLLAGRRVRPQHGAGDTSWDVADADTVAGLVAEYEASCDRSRTAAASCGLNDVVSHPAVGEVTVRWVYVHMIEETARHAGHADILRELTDGVTGLA